MSAVVKPVYHPPVGPGGWGGMTFELPKGFAPLGANDPLPPLGRGGGLIGRGLGRLLGPIGIALTIWELYELYKNAPQPQYRFYGWDLIQTCGAYQAQRWYNAPSCSTISAPASFGFPMNQVPTVTPVFTLYDSGPHFFNRAWKPYQKWAQTSPVTQVLPQVNYFPGPALHPETSPVVPRPAFNPNVQPASSVAPNPDLDPAPRPEPGAAPAPRARLVARPGQPLARMPLAPRNPRPPSRGEKEKKVRTRGGVALFRFLDFVSETSDVIDAFWQALPDDTRKKWKCDKPLKGGIVGSNAVSGGGSQYGIAGAECKLEALWHNWHKLDAVKAVGNLLTNEIEDRILGRAYAAADKLRPRNQLRKYHD